jgi:DegV family protein with EDD domain
MEKIVFSSDSTCDLSPELLAELRVTLTRLTVTLGDAAYRDGLTVSPEDIFRYVDETGILPKTAAVSPDEYAEVFKSLLSVGESVVHFSLSSAMSASYQNAALAASKLENVFVVDSGSLSTGTALLILKADTWRREGKTAEEIAAGAEALVPKVQASFVVDTLDYLYKGGRCSGLAKLGATVLKLHPMLLVKNKEITVHKKIRGKMKAVYKDYADILKKNFPAPDPDNAFITNSGCTPEMTKLFAAHVKKAYKFKNLYFTTAGSTITCHCGKGTLGLLFINDKEI